MKNTKEKLLQTAAAMFAQNGLEGVSTRDLAKQAGVNLCSINYYFGSKQKLYAAVIEEVSSFILNNFVQKTMVEITKDNLQMTPRAELKFIMNSFFAFLCREQTLKVKIQLLIKELLQPSPAYDVFYTKVLEPLHKHISSLISQDLGLSETNQQSILLAHTLFGQVIMFRIHQEAMFRRLGVEKYSGNLIIEIQKVLEKNCDAILDRAKEEICENS